MTSKVILLALLSLLESQEQKQTEKHGVGDTDAKTLIQETCRAAGTLCDELLQALSTGGYPETRDRILNDLAAFANSNRARLLRILFLLTSAESATTTNELDGLRLGGDAGPACSAFLEDQVALQTHMDESKAKFARALRTRNLTSLRAALENLELSEADRTTLRVHADVYAANFSVAMERLKAEGIEETGEKHERLSRMINESREAYEKYQLWLSFLTWSSRGHTHGYLSNGRPYVPEGMSEQASSAAPLDLRVIASSRLEAFAAASTHLQIIAPLDDLAVSSLFLTALFFQPYDEFESLADELLEGRSVLTIPFDTEVGRVELEINLASRRLKTVGRGFPEFATYKTDNWVPHSVDFDLAFDEIKKLSQRVEFVDVATRHTRAEYGVQTSRQGVFLDLEPSGTVGTLVLFNDFSQVFGEVDARQLMHNFASYLLHLIDDERVAKRSRPVLIDKDRGRWLNLARIAVPAVGNHGFRRKLTDDFERGVQATQRRGQEEVVDWHERLTERAFDTIEKTYLAPMDELLKCAPPSVQLRMEKDVERLHGEMSINGSGGTAGVGEAMSIPAAIRPAIAVARITSTSPPRPAF